MSVFEDATRKYFALTRIHRGDSFWDKMKESEKNIELSEIMSGWEIAGNQGHSESQYLLGTVHMKLKLPGGQEWFRMAARSGHSKAQFALAEILIENEDLVSTEESIRWCMLAAAQGDCRAKYLLARRYDTGNGVPQNYEHALELYKEVAIEQKHLGAESRIGEMLRQDLGTQKHISDVGLGYIKSAMTMNTDNRPCEHLLTI